VRTLTQGNYRSGEYTQKWDGRNDHGDVVPAGVYFIRLSTPAGEKTQRVTFVR